MKILYWIRIAKISELFNTSTLHYYYMEYELRSFVCGEYHSDLLVMGTV